MTFTRIVNGGFFLSMVLFLLPGYVCAMKTLHGGVADPETGAAVKDAQVFVMLAGTMKKADVFADSHGKTRIPNPVIADAGGRYRFYVPNGKYRLRILSPKAKLLYDHDDVSIYDPREPRTIFANEHHPALTLNTPPVTWRRKLAPDDRETRPKGKPAGSQVEVQTHTTEVGFGMFYNFRRRAGIPRWP